MAKLLIYYNPRMGNYNMKVLTYHYGPIPKINGFGHILVDTIQLKDKRPFKYKLADKLENCLSWLKK